MASDRPPYQASTRKAAEPAVHVHVDAKRVSLLVDNVLGRGRGDSLWGLLNLWEFIGARGLSAVPTEVIEGCFWPGDPKLLPALVGLEFLAPGADGKWLINSRWFRYGAVNYPQRQRRAGASVGYVYFIRAGTSGPIKIGFSADPNERLRSLQTAHSQPLQLLAVEGPASADRETSLHERFADARHQGEWFEPTPDLLDLIRSLGGQP